jgi:hypothetical protein
LKPGQRALVESFKNGENLKGIDVHLEDAYVKGRIKGLSI